MKVVEVYASTQGEGPNVGRTTVFTRFAGCNLRCPGWPCDTPFAIDPERYRDQWKERSPIALAEEVIEEAERVGAKYVTLTGGEPWLQQNDEMDTLVSILSAHGLSIDCFSNGTRGYPQWAVDEIEFIMDFKLPGSGEALFGFTNPTRWENLQKLVLSPKQQSVKFVIKDRNDYEIAKSLYYTNLPLFEGINIYYGAVWGEITTAELVDWVLGDNLP